LAFDLSAWYDVLNFMSLKKFLSPRNDLAFKRIFGSEKNQDILIHFLNDIFEGHTSPVEKVTFLRSVQEPEVAAQRISIVDIMCEAVNGDRFIVEMQVLHEPGFEKRAQFYAARAYIDQRKTDKQYKDLKQVIFLAITDFTLFPNKPGYLSHHQILDIHTYERDLKDFSFSFLELPKFRKPYNALTTMIEKWAYFFKNGQETSDKDLDIIAGSDTIIKRAYDELDRFTWSDEELRTYDSIDMKKAADAAILEGALLKGKAEGLAEGMEKGKAEGLVEGMEKGKAEGIEKVAQALLRKGYDLTTVAEITGLEMEHLKMIHTKLELFTL
jgi:predicted transposase/invertase (TIGR01784 family)